MAGRWLWLLWLHILLRLHKIYPPITSPKASVELNDNFTLVSVLEPMRLVSDRTNAEIVITCKPHYIRRNRLCQGFGRLWFFDFLEGLHW